MKVKIKKLIEEAVIPSYAHKFDAGLDLTAAYFVLDTKKDCFVYHTGIAMEIPEGHVGLVFPRSSNRNTEAYMTNSVGVIDSNYRGEILVCFKNRTATDTTYDINDIAEILHDYINDDPKYTDINVDKDSVFDTNRYLIKPPYNVGDRVAQLIIIPYPHIEFEEVDELSDTDRGTNGHGSTGK